MLFQNLPKVENFHYLFWFSFLRWRFSRPESFDFPRTSTQSSVWIQALMASIKRGQRSYKFPCDAPYKTKGVWKWGRGGGWTQGGELIWNSNPLFTNHPPHFNMRQGGCRCAIFITALRQKSSLLKKYSWLTRERCADEMFNIWHNA